MLERIRPGPACLGEGPAGVYDEPAAVGATERGPSNSCRELSSESTSRLLSESTMGNGGVMKVE
jgi:hypothetical protein